MHSKVKMSCQGKCMWDTNMMLITPDTVTWSSLIFYRVSAALDNPALLFLDLRQLLKHIYSNKSVDDKGQQDYQRHHTVSTLLTRHCDQLLHRKRLLVTRYVPVADRLHVLEERRSSDEDDVVRVLGWFNCKAESVCMHLPRQVTWCLGADAGYSKNKPSGIGVYGL